MINENESYKIKHKTPKREAKNRLIHESIIHENYCYKSQLPDEIEKKWLPSGISSKNMMTKNKTKNKNPKIVLPDSKRKHTLRTRIKYIFATTKNQL